MFIIYQKDFVGPKAPATDFIILFQSKVYDRQSMQKRLQQLGFEAQLPAEFAPLEEQVETVQVRFNLGIAQCTAQTIGTESENKTIQSRIEPDGENWVFISEWVDLPAPPDPVFRKQVSRTEYYGLFTPTEEAMIRLAASEEVTAALVGAADEAEQARLMGIASLAVMLRRTDALGPDDTIDLASAQVIGGLDLLAAAGLLTSERKDEILAGIVV
jgi:hypothetical protein